MTSLSAGHASSLPSTPSKPSPTAHWPGRCLQRHTIQQLNAQTDNDDDNGCISSSTDRRCLCAQTTPGGVSGTSPGCGGVIPSLDGLEAGLPALGDRHGSLLPPTLGTSTQPRQAAAAISTSSPHSCSRRPRRRRSARASCRRSR